MIRFLSFWILSGVLEYPFWEVFLGPAPFFLDRHPFYSMGLHAAAVAVLFFSSRVIPKTFLLFPAVFPVFGWAAMAAFYFLRRGLPPVSSPAGEEATVAQDSTRSKAIKFLNALEALLHSNFPKNKDCFQHIFKVREFLRMPGSSTKSLMESVALIVPNF